MDIVNSIKDMKRIASAARSAGKSISLVPTMGYLHEGHVSLMREGRRRGDLLVASIFVNPTQFGAGEDFEKYPRDLDRDARIAGECGVDILFTPAAAEMYPPGYQTWVNVENVSRPMCGASRPGHFRGVATVVAKLFNIVRPHCAIFGEKDYQQLLVISRMVADLDMDVEVVGMPTVREPDGLAMSSRNAYLSPSERLSALCLSRALAAASDLYRSGESSVAGLREAVKDIILKEPTAVIDYVEFRDGDTLEEADYAGDRTILALAVRIGKTRLIDNTMIGRDFTWKERC